MFKIRRPPDLIIYQDKKPYLRRWYVIPRNRLFNIYLHNFLRSDEDRALHDHPWLFNASILLKGRYIEHQPGGKTKKRRPGAVYFRFGKAPHRVELYLNYVFGEPRPSHTFPGLPINVTGPAPVWTLFITGPRIREWGFYCPKGWRHWQEFTSNTPGASDTGKGCD